MCTNVFHLRRTFLTISHDHQSLMFLSLFFLFLFLRFITSFTNYNIDFVTKPHTRFKLPLQILQHRINLEADQNTDISIPSNLLVSASVKILPTSFLLSEFQHFQCEVVPQSFNWKKRNRPSFLLFLEVSFNTFFLLNLHFRTLKVYRASITSITSSYINYATCKDACRQLFFVTKHVK